MRNSSHLIAKRYYSETFDAPGSTPGGGLGRARVSPLILKKLENLGYEDPLGPMKGIIAGLVLGALSWAIIIVVVRYMVP